MLLSSIVPFPSLQLFLEEMEQIPENYDLGENNKNANRKVTKVDQGIRSKMCNQCEFASSETGALKKHLKRHSGKNIPRIGKLPYGAKRGFLKERLY